MKTRVITLVVVLVSIAAMLGEYPWPPVSWRW
jgi:hypothetical protein